ncbi:GNAT family N-acetyltransferase [Paraurantiacibacter namhicola]|uniref:Ribosomal-protein-alanine N-acetyltransferase n=1 Tax=Paraurantiacibacter namhicola TaxID=645517 RepID=A0A1C7D7Y5_9SPHN|nr:GNAT family N-acetyltransferase [Paraurantiacibacter namhicola]ANU07568.1 ribosomal-protein-alanine N-acetyltransferase [Paraurantiacibacter namhicola]
MDDPNDAIMAVMQAAFDPQFGEAWNRKQVADALILPHTHHLLAAPDGQPPAALEDTAGFVVTRHVSGEEELLLIAAHPDYRGRGLGKAMMARALEAARARGTTRMFLEMRDGNPAERLYTAHGFTAVGRRRAYYTRGTSGPFDAVTFAREL